MPKVRRSIGGGEKIAILRKLLVEKVPVSQLCDEHSLRPTQVYQWQRQLFEQGAGVFDRSAQKSRSAQNQLERKITKLEETIQVKNEVVAELLQEHVQLKKEIGEP